MRTIVLFFYTIVAATSVFAEKTLMYDEEKGIIFVDKDQPVIFRSKKEAAAAKPQTSPVEKPRLRAAVNGTTVDATIQRGRQKDPPEVYFESGLQYFKSGFFEDALKNFTHADSLDPQPKYMLWMGKALRQLHKNEQLLFTMNRLASVYPESDVADDALFEMAFCYQTNDEYALAEKTYKKLSEQYPFGTSYSNGENFRSIAYKQCRMMRSEMQGMLAELGFAGEDLESLYGAFQKSKELSVTGIGSRATVMAIKAAHADHLRQAQLRAQRQERMQKYRPAAITLGVLLFCNCLILFIVNRKIAAKRKTLAMLTQTLSELTPGVP